MLEARALAKRFGDVQALHPLSLKIEAGEVMCMLGANGAGKTTTINLFLGFIEPSSGEASIDGVSVQEDPVGTKAKLAYIPEQVALYANMTGLENLRFLSELAGQTGYSDTDLLTFTRQAGLEDVAARRHVSGYSKGMRQKVGIAAALAKKATSFLLDEPLSGLDPEAANELTRLIQILRSEGAAILIATHDIFRAMEVGSRIGIMKAGRMVEVLDPSAVDAAEVEKIYLNHMRGVHGVQGMERTT